MTETTTPGTTPEATSGTTPGGQQRTIQRELVIAGAVLVTVAAVICGMAIQLAARRDFQVESSGTFPLIVGAGLLIFSVLFLIQALRPTDGGYLVAYMENEKKTTRMWVVVWIVLTLVVFAFIVPYAGYTLSTAALFVTVARLLGEKRWWLNVLVGLGLAAAVYFGFTQLLGVRLPAGFLGVI